MPYTKKSYQKPTICWKCKNAVPGERYGCEWSRCFEPVPGWDAEETWLRGYTQGRYTDWTLQSFHVKSCPKFIKDDEKGTDTWDGVPEARPKSTDKPTGKEIHERIAAAVKKVAERNRDPFGGNHGR